MIALVLLVAVAESRPGRGHGRGRHPHFDLESGEDRPTRDPNHTHADSSSEEVTGANGEIIRPTRQPDHTHADGVTHDAEVPHRRPHGRRPHGRPQRNRD